MSTIPISWDGELVYVMCESSVHSERDSCVIKKNSEWVLLMWVAFLSSGQVTGLLTHGNAEARVEHDGGHRPSTQQDLHSPWKYASGRISEGIMSIWTEVGRPTLNVGALLYGLGFLECIRRRTWTNIYLCSFLTAPVPCAVGSCCCDFSPTRTVPSNREPE